MLIGKRNNLPYLHRDTILVRFFHSFLSSAPHIVIHAYASVIALTSSSSLLNPVSPAVLSALGISIISVLYTLLSFSTNDRVSGKNRRVILPAHLAQVLWHLCMIVSRVVALVMFAYTYGYYVVAVVGGHWVLMVFILLLERTTFCADIERQSDGDLKFTRRLCLEIPFDLIAAAVYVFAYFNLKRGRIRVWAGVYHLVMLTENVTMAVLFHLNPPSSLTSYSSSSLLTLIPMIVVVTLYPVGLVFMFCYYLLYHPKRTGNCSWIGFPRKCWCSSKVEQNEDGPVIGTYQHRNSRVIISEPTLVSHNGYVPKNLLPVGPNAVNTVNQNETQLSSHSQSVSMPYGRVSRDRSLTEPNGRRANNTTGSMGGRQESDRNGDGHLHNLPILSPDSSRTNTARTVSESNPVFSDFPASDTDFSSSNALEANDTVIDTPLFGYTPETSMEAGLMRMRLISQDVDSQKTCTNDTGIDVDSDLQLSPGTVGGDLEDMVGMISSAAEGRDNGRNILPVFVDVPTKHGNYRSGLEQHYFPSDKATRRDPPKQQAPRTIALHNRGSVTPTLPTPTNTPSPTSLTPISTRAQWRHLSEDSEEVWAGSSQRPRREASTPQSSPERPMKTPRSPIGSRSHQVTMDDGEHSGSQQSTHNEQPRTVTPRSPKGARRLLLQQPSPALPTLSTQERAVRRRAPPPPRPPRTSSMPNGDTLVQSTPADSVAVSVTEMFQPLNQPQPPHQPHQSQPVHHPKPIAKAPALLDGLTRGLSSLVPPVGSKHSLDPLVGSDHSLVPVVGSERRAHSSSPFPVTRQKITPQTTVQQYSRSASHNPNAHNPNVAADSQVRTPRDASKRVSALEGQVIGGSTHSTQYYHAQPRPKSDGWRVDMTTAGHGRGGYRLGNSHGSSPERTPYSSTSSDQRLQSVSSANNIDGQNRPSHARYQDMQRRRKYSHANPAMPKSTPYYSTNVPTSAFNRVSPERHRAQHVGGAGGQGLQQPQSYSSNMNGSTGGSPSRSPRRYPKAPQGASANAPKMLRPPLPKGQHIPPLPPPRADQSIDEPLTNLNSSSYTHSMGSLYDKLPAETRGHIKTPVVGRAGNRASFMSPASLHPPQSSTHESVV